MNDAITVAVSNFRKACVEYGEYPCLGAADRMFAAQAALFAIVDPSPNATSRGAADQSAMEHYGYATGDIVTRGGDDLYVVVQVADGLTGRLQCIYAPWDGQRQIGDTVGPLLHRYTPVPPERLPEFLTKMAELRAVHGDEPPWASTITGGAA